MPQTGSGNQYIPMIHSNDTETMEKTRHLAKILHQKALFVSCRRTKEEERIGNEEVMVSEIRGRETIYPSLINEDFLSRRGSICQSNDS